MKIPVTVTGFRDLREIAAYLRALASSIAAGWRVEHTDTGTHNFQTTQTTVGAAGSASALPATPTGYFVIKVDGTERVVPYYAKS